MLRRSNEYGREDITASVERLRDRLDEVKVWLKTARFIAGDEVQDSTKRSYAAGVFRYLLMLRISTKAVLFEKLRSKQAREARSKGLELSVSLHALPSAKERERERKESIRLLDYADRCNGKRLNNQLCYSRVTRWPFDFPYIAIALKTIGMNSNDDLMPSEIELSNPSEPNEESPAHTQPQGDLASRAAQGSDLDDGLKSTEPSETSQQAEPLPSEPIGHAEPGGPPPVSATTGTSSKRSGGRPKHPATKSYKQLAAQIENLSIFDKCKVLEKKHTPLPHKLSSYRSWTEACQKDRQKVGAWFREMRRAPRVRGKLKMK